MPCASAAKINLEESVIDNDNEDYNMFLNFGILKSFLVNFLQCPQCKENDVNLWNDSSKRWFLLPTPESVFISKKVLELGVFSAIIEFNDGCSGLNPVFELFGIGDGKFKV